MQNNQNNSVPQVGLTSILGVVFVVLKLTGTIDWSWVWVLSPWWITLSLALGFFMLGAVITLFSKKNPYC